MKILLVEDNIDISSNIKKILELEDKTFFVEQSFD
jgi:DNA-binding response OmpR family regulator